MVKIQSKIPTLKFDLEESDRNMELIVGCSMPARKYSIETFELLDLCAQSPSMMHN
jgi:hypothetical protein